MISILDRPKPVPGNEGEDPTAAVPKDTSTPMEESSPFGAETSKTDDASSTDIQTSIPMMNGLSSAMRTQLLVACVSLVGIPADRDALNAVLRLCLRLTQDFDQAVIFTQLGGMKMLLGLTQVRNAKNPALRGGNTTLGIN